MDGGSVFGCVLPGLLAELRYWFFPLSYIPLFLYSSLELPSCLLSGFLSLLVFIFLFLIALILTAACTCSHLFLLPWLCAEALGSTTV